MSERKVLNVSISILDLLIMGPSITYVIYAFSCIFLEILSSGFRSVEDSTYEIGQKQTVYSSSYGSFQYALQNLRRVYLQGEEVQCTQRRC